MMKTMLATLLLLFCVALTPGDALAQVCDGSAPTGSPCTTPLGPDQPGHCDGNGQCILPTLPPCMRSLDRCNLSPTELGVCDVFAGAATCINPSNQCPADQSREDSHCLMQGGGDGTCHGTQCCSGSGGDGSCDISDGTCTSEEIYNITPPAAGQGIVSSIVTSVKNVLNGVSSTMFTRIVQDSGFKLVVSALITLYVAIYGVLFMFAMVQITVHDFMIRMVKVSIVAVLLSPGAWGFFNNTVVKFFNEGTDSLINKVTSIAVGLENLEGSGPFSVLDNAIAQAVSAKMAITLMATFLTGPYGPIIGLLLLMSLGSFFKALMNAMWVYIMALVMRALLFGLAPLFLICILFSRTRHLFDGWLNQLINACLQPILLFTFFAFFCQLIKACLEQVLNLEVCWTAWSEIFRGTPFIGHYWRFAVWNASTGLYEPFNGIWGWNGPEGVPGNPPVNPVGIMLPLTLWILADLAGRFNTVVIDIAKDIAGASTTLTMGGESIKDWFGGGGGGNRGGGGGNRGGGGASSGGASAPGSGGGTAIPPVRPPVGNNPAPANPPAPPRPPGT